MLLLPDSLIVAAPAAEKNEQSPLCPVAHQVNVAVIVFYQESLYRRKVTHKG